MSKKGHYPPSYVRYQLENPGVTVRVNKKLKAVLDAVKGNRSYAQVILDLLTEKLNPEQEIKKVPVTELIRQYTNGFTEAFNRYGIVAPCKKCGADTFPVWTDGKCDKCHSMEYGEPKLSNFKGKVTIDPEDYDRVGHVSILDPEKAAYQAGREKGYDEGFDAGYNEGHGDAEGEFKITYPCSRCGKPTQMKRGEKDHIAMVQYMKEHGWHRHEC